MTYLQDLTITLFELLRFLLLVKKILSKVRYEHFVGVVVHSVGWGYDDENLEMIKIFPDIGVSVS
jgi:hypothetical protein